MDAIYPGPCVSCGTTDYGLSMGGPGICPSCDCGPPSPRQVRELREHIAALIGELAQAHKAANAYEAMRTAIIETVRRFDENDATDALEAVNTILRAALESAR